GNPIPDPTNPVNMNDATQQLAATQRTLEVVAQEFETQARRMPAWEQQKLDLPKFIIDEAKKEVTLSEPLKPDAQKQLWDHEKKKPAQGVVQAGANGSNPNGNLPGVPSYRTTSQRWGIGGSYFALLAFYEIGADRQG